MSMALPAMSASFEIPLGDIYEQVYANKAPETVLTSPYFHL